CREFLLRVAAAGPGVATGEIPFPTGTVPKAGRKLTGVAAGDLEELAGRARKLLEDCSLIDPMAGLLIELLLPFAEHFRAQLAIEGFVSFDELLLRTRDLLRDNRQVRQKEKGRIRSLLVDEFQDTNPLQYEIVFFLSEIPDDFDRDAYATRLEPGKLFIVGDPKQSIYRFRGADIEAYMDAVRRIEAGGGEILTLVSNFRSPAEILDPLNRMFQVAFGRPGPAQPEYAAISSARGNAADSPRVRIWSVPSEGEKEPAGKGRRRQGRVIAEWIGRTVVAGGLAYRDIALLFRAMPDVNLYLRPLREAGIPFVVEGGKVFGRKPEVREFLSLLRLLVNPNDGVALLAVLRSPLGGAADAELARHAAAGGRWNLDASTDPGPCPNLARTLKDLRDLRERIAGYPADRAVRCVLEDTHLLEFNAAAYEGTQRVVNLWKIADRVAHRARNDHLSLESTVRSLEREFAAEELEDPESPLADEALDAVRVLTVHKAKGLEFPVVIVPDLARRARYGDDSGAGIGWLGTGKGRKAVAVQIGSGPDKRYNPAAVIHRQTYRLHADAERIRALYVACTRAKETLILVASASTTAPWMKCLSAWEYRWEGGEPPPATRFYHDQVGHEPMIPSGAPPAVKSHVPDGDEITDATARFETARKQAEAHRHRRWIRTPSGLREELERDQDPELPANFLPRLPQPGAGEDAAPVRTA
ncbi:MAG: UvrD-helicase domain-containing protein, partial [Acidobacteriota bacterium]